ncbi:MAG TPA: hypothetical protein VLT91_07735, partial [Rhizomicrobium sp.]|nr:hypothetical protein [Rhizomicrobium sp.]
MLATQEALARAFALQRLRWLVPFGMGLLAFRERLRGGLFVHDALFGFDAGIDDVWGLGVVGILVFFTMRFGMGRIAGFGDRLLIDNAFVGFFVGEVFERIFVVVIVFDDVMRMFVFVLVIPVGREIGLFDVEPGFDLAFGDVLAALVVEEFVFVLFGLCVGLVFNRLSAVLGRNLLSAPCRGFRLFFGFKFLVGDHRGPGFDGFEAFFFCAAARFALLLFEQGLTVGDRDLVVVG